MLEVKSIDRNTFTIPTMLVKRTDIDDSKELEVWAGRVRGEMFS